ncbi:MAG: VWA domain-containing protein [Desulfobacteraceae bacterium]|nr:VWA domain-containing protein [Desulfobacteraceae bacterium]
MDDIQQELEFLAVQAESPDQHVKIQKLSPAQMAALATSLGRKHGIKVKFGDFQTASTDGNTISLPLTNKENSWINRGLLDHETAHIRLTDFSHVPGQLGFRRTLWNVIEDVRIEATMPVFYPGMRSNYRALIRELRKTSPEMFAIKLDDPPDAIVAGYISLVLRALYLRQAEVADLAIEARDVFIRTFGPSLEADLYCIISKIDNVETPQDVMDLVDEIVALLEKHASEQDQAGDADTEQGQGPGGENTGQAQGSDTAEPEQGAQGQDGKNGGPGQKEDSGAADLSSAQPGDSTDLQTDLDLNNPEKSAAIKQALEAQTERGDFGDQLKEIMESGTRPGNEHVEIAVPALKADLIATGYQKQPITAHSGLVAQLSSRLRGLLQAQDLQHAKPGMTGNRIARNRLHRIKTGDPRLFLRKTPKKAVNTAVHLLLDNSSSMDENQRFHITKEVTLALVKSLENMRGINPAVTVFPAFYPYNRRNNGTAAPVARLLSHGEKSGRNMLYPGGPKGQTPLHAAVRFVASEMLGLSEPRKILVILTDGEPDCTEDAEMAIQEAGDLGIQVVCLGIEQLVETQIFPHFEIVQSVRDLPEKAFSLLERLLTRQ